MSPALPPNRSLIEIIREVAATAAKPVMLYSIGKDSSVMLRLAQRALTLANTRFVMHTHTVTVSEMILIL